MRGGGEGGDEKVGPGEGKAGGWLEGSVESCAPELVWWLCAYSPSADIQTPAPSCSYDPHGCLHILLISPQEVRLQGHGLTSGAQKKGVPAR